MKLTERYPFLNVWLTSYRRSVAIKEELFFTVYGQNTNETTSSITSDVQTAMSGPLESTSFEFQVA